MCFMDVTMGYTPKCHLHNQNDLFNLFSPPHPKPLTNSKGIPETYSTLDLYGVILVKREPATGILRPTLLRSVARGYF